MASLTSLHHPLEKTARVEASLPLKRGSHQALFQSPALKLLPMGLLPPAVDRQKQAEARSEGRIQDHTMMRRSSRILASLRDQEMITTTLSLPAVRRDVIGTAIGTGMTMMSHHVEPSL